MTRLKKSAKLSSTTMPRKRAQLGRPISVSQRHHAGAATDAGQRRRRPGASLRVARRRSRSSRRAATSAGGSASIGEARVSRAAVERRRRRVHAASRHRRQRRSLGLALHLARSSAGDARLGHAGEGRRVDADPDDQDEQREQHRQLARREIGAAARFSSLGDLAEDHALVHPEQVGRGEDDAGGGERPPASAVRAGRRPAGSGTRRRSRSVPGSPIERQRDDQEERREHRHHLRAARRTRRSARVWRRS